MPLIRSSLYRSATSHSQRQTQARHSTSHQLNTTSPKSPVNLETTPPIVHDVYSDNEIVEDATMSFGDDHSTTSNTFADRLQSQRTSRSHSPRRPGATTNTPTPKQTTKVSHPLTRHATSKAISNTINKLKRPRGQRKSSRTQDSDDSSTQAYDDDVNYGQNSQPSRPSGPSIRDLLMNPVGHTIAPAAESTTPELTTTEPDNATTTFPPPAGEEYTPHSGETQLFPSQGDENNNT